MDGDHSVSADFSLAEDGVSQTFASATALGTVGCGSTVTRSGTTTQSGESKWLQFTMPSCASATVALSGSGGETFDVDTTATTTVFHGGGPSQATLTTSGTYYIRIYNDGAYACSLQCGTGIWTITIAVT
jgi:hypothetical protein